MCGIAGLFSGSSPCWAQPLVERIVADQRARGPDHQAVERVALPRDGLAVLGHDRLSIIDLSAAGNQPMWDASRRHAVVFNGEIYNYLELRAELEGLGCVFRTRTDTEVIIAAFHRWGVDAVSRFNGMFAFALLDREARRLWLCRDRFGVKPCLFHVNADALAFASSARVLARHFGLRPDLEYVGRGLRSLVYDDSSERSQYEGLRSLPPGTMLEARLDDGGRLSAELHRYYDLSARVERTLEEANGSDEAALARRVKETLTDAVRLRTRADVPVGVSLSGGLDSATVTGLLAGQQAQVTGFSFASPHDPRSEGPAVDRIVSTTGVRVEYIWPTAAEIIAVFEDVVAAQDAPFASGSTIAQYMVFRRARELGFKVLMGGQGGDESFMGYRKFQLFHLKQLVHERWHERFLVGAAWLLPLVLSELRLLPSYWRHRHRYLGAGGASDKVKTPLSLPPFADRELGHALSEPLYKRQIADVTDFSLPTLLRYEDRNSMDNSIETRLPFMDYRLVELGIALPVTMKLRKGYGKWVIRDVTRGVVPESVRMARFKVGFQTQESRWIDGGLGDAIRVALRSRAAGLAGYLRPGFVLDEAYSNQQLKHRPGALAEAIGLTWLGNYAT
jgi:asparagine synthase (glutamine-hydrolysing)